MFNTFSVLFVQCVWSIMPREENETVICSTGRLHRCGMCLNSPLKNWQRVTWSWSANFKSSSRKSRNMWRNKPKIIRRYGSCRHIWCLINIHVSLLITCRIAKYEPNFSVTLRYTCHPLTKVRGLVCNHCKIKPISSII